MSPWVAAFRDDLALPSAVFGPVLLRELTRLDSHFFWLDMSGSRFRVAFAWIVPDAPTAPIRAWRVPVPSFPIVGGGRS